MRVCCLRATSDAGRFAANVSRAGDNRSGRRLRQYEFIWFAQSIELYRQPGVAA
jgi:hypothetical protein